LLVGNTRYSQTSFEAVDVVDVVGIVLINISEAHKISSSLVSSPLVSRASKSEEVVGEVYSRVASTVGCVEVVSNNIIVAALILLRSAVGGIWQSFISTSP